jgi:hypothetical protein
VQVRAFNAVGGSPWSEVLEVTTQPAAPAAPASLAAAAASSSSMALTWRAPAEDNGAPVVSYVLEMAAGSAGSNHAGSTAWTKVWQGSSGECSSSSGSLSHTVDGLLPGRRYSWRLRAANSCGLGPWAEAVDGKTLAAAPGVAAKPSVSKITASSAIIKWAIPLEDNGSSVDSYTLQVRQHGRDWETLLERSALLTHKATGLQPGCPYEVRVAAANSEGSGPFSEAVGWTTSLLPPPAPRSVAAELSQQQQQPAEPLAAAAGKQQQQRHSVTVSWQAARTPCSCAQTVGYEVEAAPTAASSAAGTSSSHAAAVKANVGQACSAQLSGLRGGLTYHVRVRAVGKGGAGHSPWSEAVSVEMPPAPADSIADAADDSSSAAPGDAPGKRGAKARKGAKADAAGAEAAAGSKPRARPKPKQSWRLPKPLRKNWAWLLAAVILVMSIALGARHRSTAKPPGPQQAGVEQNPAGVQQTPQAFIGPLTEQQHAAVATGPQEQPPEQRVQKPAHFAQLTSQEHDLTLLSPMERDARQRAASVAHKQSYVINQRLGQRQSQLEQQKFIEQRHRFSPEQQNVLQQYPMELELYTSYEEVQQLERLPPEQLQQHLERDRARFQQLLRRVAQHAELTPQQLLLLGDISPRTLDQLRALTHEQLREHMLRQHAAAEVAHDYEAVRRAVRLHDSLVQAPSVDAEQPQQPEAVRGGAQQVHAAAAEPQAEGHVAAAPAVAQQQPEGQQPEAARAQQQQEAAPSQQPQPKAAHAHHQQPEEQPPAAGPAEVAYGLNE